MNDQPNNNQDIKLPEGKTCGDCRTYNYCQFLFQCPASNTVCDWSPSRFKVAVQPQVATATSSQGD